MRTNLDKEVDKRMGLIKSICPGASIEFRTHHIDGATKWYVSTPGLELAQDGMLGSIDSNGASPDEAVSVLYLNLTNTQHVFKKDNKRYLRWTGYMFDEALPPEAQR